jgi:hypothetical protein
MEFACQQKGCPKKAKRSCICDSKVRLCSSHFIKVHQKLPGNHDDILILDQIKHFNFKAQEAYQKLKKVKNSIISKGNFMINKIELAIKKNLSKLLTKKTQIARISKCDDDLQHNLNLLEKVKLQFQILKS